MKTFKVTSMEEMALVLDIPLNQGSDSTTLDNIDDDMCIVSSPSITTKSCPLPTNDFNFRTLSQEQIDSMRQEKNPNIVWSNNFYAFR